MTVAMAVAFVVVGGAGACSNGGSGKAAAPAATTTSTSPLVSTTVAGAVTTFTTTGGSAATTSTTPSGSTGTTVAGDVTLRGTVLTVFASARVLELDPPVKGYSKVALTSDTEYRLADGSPGSLVDVDEGSTVDVTGVPGSPGTVIARLVVLVG